MTEDLPLSSSPMSSEEELEEEATEFIYPKPISTKKLPNGKNSDDIIVFWDLQNLFFENQDKIGVFIDFLRTMGNIISINAYYDCNCSTKLITQQVRVALMQYCVNLIHIPELIKGKTECVDHAMFFDACLAVGEQAHLHASDSAKKLKVVLITRDLDFSLLANELANSYSSFVEIVLITDTNTLSATHPFRQAANYVYNFWDFEKVEAYEKKKLNELVNEKDKKKRKKNLKKLEKVSKIDDSKNTKSSIPPPATQNDVSNTKKKQFPKKMRKDPRKILGSLKFDEDDQDLKPLTKKQKRNE